MSQTITGEEGEEEESIVGTSQFRVELIISSLDQVRFDHESVKISQAIVGCKLAQVCCIKYSL
jgi:hypothetical protein